MADFKVISSDLQDQNYETRVRTNSFGTTASTPSSSSDYITGDADDSSDSKGTIPFTLKSVETQLLLSADASEEDLKEMERKCKQMVLESEECSEERKWLVRRLIELRLRVQELRETSDESLLETQVILGHHLVPQKHHIVTTGPIYCDHCSGAIWTMLQSWYMCSESSWVEPRLCDYNGLYYCQRCHWNTLAVIPARIIRNWDMEPRRVCRAAAQLLFLIEERPVLPLERLNPKLFTLVPDLSLVKKLREELQMMKRYLVLCPDANTQGLPWRSGLRTHLVENSGNYSIKDLVDLQNGTLIEEIRAAYDAMASHITELCALCKARGHLCELCGNDEVIYPWNEAAVSCPKCGTVYHRVCWSKRNHHCPKCRRIEQRFALQSTDLTESDKECEKDEQDIEHCDISQKDFLN
ncbi:differentially expressed in FDCP 8 homolog isoform X4 [Cephus cinctus]|uniref:Differentially expressed in FDCP 8 homolog isoform X4 n=1 Tax=Cephus cinctus TaxID=211228 RepID=A0AAJ7RNJ3_CEPCN|nr:differentially expressed in FDCP 8 homolog isoform X4 [Cephus cinctus]